MKNIFAYTETEYKTYPGYVSYNRQGDGMMTLSVRSKDSSGVQEIEFPLYQFWKFVDAVSNFDLPGDVDEIEFLPKVFFEKLAAQYAEKESELEAAKKRELELLAVIEKQRQQVDKFADFCEELIGSKDYVGTGSLKVAKAEEKEDREKLKQILSISETEPSQALREHEAKVLEAGANACELMGEAGHKLLRRMAEERRKK